MQGDERPRLTGWRRDLVLFLDHQIYRLSKHWLTVFNLLVGTYVMLPVLAPVLMAAGATDFGNAIYLLYRPACHQLPERSFFLFGPKMTYTIDELWSLGLLPQPDDIFARRKFVGAPIVGYKMAICERDIALYGGLFLGGLAFGLFRRRIRPLSLVGYAICLLPMAIDGGTQLFMLRESNWMLRVFTGGLAGVASAWMLYPRLDAAFADVGWQARRHLEP